MESTQLDVKSGSYKAPLAKNKKLALIWRQKYLLLMSVPFMIWLIIFKYTPLWGWTMAFQEYIPGKGFFEQKWVGLKNFASLFHNHQFYQVMRNTLVMSFLNLICAYTLPIIFALLINEVRKMAFKRTIQTVSYLPHFVSWVIVASIFAKMLSIDGGVVNQILLSLNIIDQPIQFFSKPELFWGINTFAVVWKEMGWNSIIILAAIAGINPELYEAATVDGAGRFKKIWHVTLPGIAPTVLVMLIMSIGWLISIGFESQYLLGNNVIKGNAYVLDWYILDYGIASSRFSFGTAAGMFQSVVSLVLVFSANTLSKRMFKSGIV